MYITQTSSGQETREKKCTELRLYQSFEFAVYRTVLVAFIHMSDGVLSLLEVLAFLGQIIDRDPEDAHLFTSARNFALLDVWDLMKAWTVAVKDDSIQL